MLFHKLGDLIIWSDFPSVLSDVEFVFKLLHCLDLLITHKITFMGY